MASKPTNSASGSSARKPAAAYPVEFEALVQWLEAAALARGPGGKKELAGLLGVSASCLSQILGRRAGFDQKTLALMSLILTSKAEQYPDAPVVSSATLHGIVMEGRRAPNGEKIYTWRKAK